MNGLARYVECVKESNRNTNGNTWCYTCINNIKLKFILQRLYSTTSMSTT